MSGGGREELWSLLRGVPPRLPISRRLLPKGGNHGLAGMEYIRHRVAAVAEVVRRGADHKSATGGQGSKICVAAGRRVIIAIGKHGVEERFEGQEKAAYRIADGLVESAPNDPAPAAQIEARGTVLQGEDSATPP
jgi:hypothetical protein